MKRDFNILKERMIKRQIEARGITNTAVLNAVRKVDRHLFVTDQYVNEAYEDYPLPIGHGQTISQPYIVALMTELCSLNKYKRVLEIGTGSGYQTAVLSLLAEEVYSIEIVEILGKAAQNRLAELHYDNIQIKVGDGYKGWPEEAPFDVIILTAGPSELPKDLLDQLSDNGCMIAPVGDYTQELVKVTKQNGRLNKEIVTYVRFVPMVHGN